MRVIQPETSDSVHIVDGSEEWRPEHKKKEEFRNYTEVREKERRGENTFDCMVD